MIGFRSIFSAYPRLKYPSNLEGNFSWFPNYIIICSFHPRNILNTPHFCNNIALHTSNPRFKSDDDGLFRGRDGKENDHQTSCIMGTINCALLEHSENLGLDGRFLAELFEKNRKNSHISLVVTLMQASFAFFDEQWTADTVGV